LSNDFESAFIDFNRFGTNVYQRGINSEQCAECVALDAVGSATEFLVIAAKLLKQDVRLLGGSGRRRITKPHQS
jgi:hypothetical protein